MLAHPLAGTAQEEIVWTESEDGIRLDGAVNRPASGPTKPLAVVQVPGFTSRFSHPVHIGLGRGLARRGYVSVTGNNRGWAFGETTSRRGDAVVIGGGWERFHEAPLDIGAWVSFALGLGARGVVLLGHSFGGPKVVAYQAERQDPRVVALVCASPGSTSEAALTPTPEAVELAERMVADGRGADLLPWGSFRGGTLSAQTLLDRAPANRGLFDVFGLFTPDPAVGRVRCPVLAFYGTRDMGGTGQLEPIALELIARNAASTRVDVRMVENADHSYTGQEDEVAAVIADWIDALQ